MEKLTRYIEGLIQEITALTKSFKRKTNSVNQSNNVVYGDIVGRDLVKNPAIETRSRHQATHDAVKRAMDLLKETKLNALIQDVSNSSISIQAGNNASIRTENITVNGSNIDIYDGKVTVDGVNVFSSNTNKEVINVFITVKAGVNVHNINAQGSVTLTNENGIIDSLYANGNINFNGFRDVLTFDTVKAEGNINIGGNLEAHAVNAGGNINSAGKISWR